MRGEKMSKDLQKAPPQSANAAHMASFQGEPQKEIPYLKTLLGKEEVVLRFGQMAYRALMRDSKLHQADVDSLTMSLV
jgi:hypothetical protein